MSKSINQYKKTLLKIDLLLVQVDIIDHSHFIFGIKQKVEM